MIRVPGLRSRVSGPTKVSVLRVPRVPIYLLIKRVKKKMTYDQTKRLIKQKLKIY